MNSSVPYLIRAINEWILDNDCTPYLILDTTMDEVSVPMEYAKDGQIVLNIGPQAIRDLQITSEYVMFSGRFSGVAHEIYAPVGAVMGIIAKENGEGMWFPREDEDPGDPPSPDDPGPRNDKDEGSRDKRTGSGSNGNKPKGPPNLKVVK